MNDSLKYWSLEDAISARILTKIGAGYVVQSLPDNESEYKKPFEKGRVTVAYRKSDFANSVSTDPIAQPETAHLEIVLECRTRRGNAGLFAMQKAVSDAVIGWRPPNWNRVWAKTHEFSERAENTWVYCLTVCCLGMLVECRDPETLPTLTNPTANYTINPNVGS